MPPIGIRVNPRHYESTSSETLLSTYAEAGMTVFEFGVAPGLPDWDIRDRLVGLCRDLGARFQFHGRFLPQAFERGDEWKKLEPEYRETLKWFGEAAATLPGQTPLTVHGPQSEQFPFEPLSLGEVKELTARFFEWLHGIIAAEELPLVICLENLPSYDKPDYVRRRPGVAKLGDTQDSLTEIEELVRGDRLRFCWDIGHEVAGPDQWQEGGPGESFLSRVANVHIHDAQAGDNALRIHLFPVPRGIVPLQRYFAALRSVSYAGPLVMETGATRCSEEEFVRLACESVGVIRRLWEEASA